MASLPAGFEIETTEAAHSALTLPVGFEIEKIGEIDGISDSAGAVSDSGGAGEVALGVGEAALSLGAGIVAEPIAGLAGVAQAINPFAEPGAGAEAVEATRKFLTGLAEPETKKGKEFLGAVGEALEPVGEALTKAETFLGDKAFDATGSPALASLASTVPTALMELLGVGVGGKAAKASKKAGPSARQVKRAVVDSSPNIETLKNAARDVYKELDESGAKIKAPVYKNLVDKIERITKKEGLDARITPKAAGAIEILKETVGKAPTLTEIDVLRKVAGKVAKNIDPTESSLGVQIISEIDDFLDKIPPAALAEGPLKASKISPKYRAARQLWGRARRSETIQEAIDKGSRAASGLENGIRNEFNRIINSKKSKFFPADEIKSMQAVVDGDFTKNMLKHAGKFGVSVDRSGSNLLAFLGGAGGFVGAGTGGGAAVVGAGTAARAIGKQLAKREAAFVDSVTRAGNNASEIAQAYLTAFPKSKRTSTDLARLFADPQIDISGMLRSKNEIIKEAAEIAEGRRVIGSAIGALSATTIQNEEK